MPWHSGDSLISSLKNLQEDIREIEAPKKDISTTELAILHLYRVFYSALKTESEKGMRPTEDLPFQRDEMFEPLNKKDPENKKSHLAICLVIQILELFRFDTSSIHKAAIKIINIKIKRNDGIENLKPVDIDLSLYESKERFKAFQNIPCFELSDSLSSEIGNVFLRMKLTPPQSREDLGRARDEIDNIVHSSEKEVFKRIELFVHNPALTVAGLKSALLSTGTLKGDPLTVDS